MMEALSAFSFLNKQLNLLLFGPKGHGKSSTANSILGVDEFPTGDSGAEEFISHVTDFQGYKVEIVDSPPALGLRSSHGTGATGYTKAFKGSISTKFPQGCHAPILVLKYGNLLESSDAYPMEILKQIFGEEFISDHCVCIITGGDTFQKKMLESGRYNSFEEWCVDQKGTLEDLFRAISYRCVLFDNGKSTEVKKREQVQELMSMILDTWHVMNLSELSILQPKRIKADIHALLETASSRDEYKKQLQFLIEYARKYNFDPQQVQMSVTIFGVSKHLRFTFSELKNHKKFAMSAPFLEPSPGVDKALARALQESFGPNAVSRPDAEQIAFIITEGQVQDASKAIEIAEKLKRDGIIIMVAAVLCGEMYSKCLATLERLASDPNDMIIGKNYGELKQLSTQVYERISEIAPQFKSTADVLFILDSSGSIGKSDYQKELDFAVKLTECFNIGSGAVRFGAMIFSSSPQLLFNFTLDTHADIKKAIMNAPYMNGGTKTAEALDLALATFLSDGGIGNRKRIAIVITDGESNNSDATSDAAERLDDAGVLIIAVGVGSAKRRELERIASRPGDVYMVDNYSALLNIQDEIARLTSNYESVNPRGYAPKPVPKPAPEPGIRIAPRRPSSESEESLMTNLLGAISAPFKFW